MKEFVDCDIQELAKSNIFESSPSVGMFLQGGCVGVGRCGREKEVSLVGIFE